MLDYLPGHSLDDADPRLLAVRFLMKHRASLAQVVAAMRDEGDAALAHALTDMMIDPTVDPLPGPIEGMLAMLCDPSAERNEDAQLLIEQLIRIRDAIDVGGV